MYGIPWAWHHSDDLTPRVLFSFSQQSHKVGTAITPIFQTKKLRHGNLPTDIGSSQCSNLLLISQDVNSDQLPKNVLARKPSCNGIWRKDSTLGHHGVKGKYVWVGLFMEP